MSLLFTVLCLVTQSCLTLQPMDCSLSRTCPWGFSRQEHWSGLLCPPPGHLPNPGIKPRSPALQADSVPSDPPVKPKNTGVGSQSFLQRIFPTQKLNQGLLHCRQILYQLSYQGSPFCSLLYVKCLALGKESEVAQSYPTLCNPMDCSPTRLLNPWNFLGKSIGVGCHFLLQGVFQAQGSNPGLLHCEQTLYRLSHQGIPCKVLDKYL